MNVYAAYILSPDGVPLVTEYFQEVEGVPNETLLAGFLTALGGIAEDLVRQKGGAEKIILHGLTYHLKSFEQFQVVIVSDIEDIPQKAVNQIGWKFMEKFDMANWNGNVSTYNPFKDELRNVLQKFFNIDMTKQIDPVKKLNTVTIMQMPKNIQEVALALLEIEVGTITDVANVADLDIDLVEESLKALHRDGYAGLKITDQGDKYFIKKN